MNPVKQSFLYITIIYVML